MLSMDGLAVLGKGLVSMPPLFVPVALEMLYLHQFSNHLQSLPSSPPCLYHVSRSA